MAVAAHFRLRQVQIGVHQARAEFDGVLGSGGRFVVAALGGQQECQVAVCLGIGRIQFQRLAVVRLRTLQTLQAPQRVGEIVVRRRPVGLEQDHALQAVEAFRKLARLLQHDAQIVPARHQRRVHGHRAAGRVFRFGEQPLLAVHLGQIAGIGSWGARCQASLAQVSDGEIEMAVGMRHQAKQVQRVGLTGPGGQHALAQQLRLGGLTGAPVSVGAVERFRDAQGFRATGRE